MVNEDVGVVGAGAVVADEPVGYRCAVNVGVGPDLRCGKQGGDGQ